MSERKPAKHVSADSVVTPSGQHGELGLHPADAGSAHVYLSQMELAELQGEATIKDHLIVRTKGGAEALAADAEDMYELEQIEPETARMNKS